MIQNARHSQMNLSDDPISLYEVLELTPDATPQEIRSAYLRLKSSYGKDNIAHYTLFSREEVESMLHKIEDAYLTLSNPEKRRAYDQSQGHSSSSHVEAVPTVTSIAQPREEAKTETSFNMMAASLLSGGSENTQSDIEVLIQNEQEWGGAAIRRVREAKRITLDDLSDYTRISKSYLAALEDEDYNRLPAVVYVRGFLQQVGKRLKLPSDVLIQKYVLRMKSARPDKA
jgi:curved DNA-binding protein CbpA